MEEYLITPELVSQQKELLTNAKYTNKRLPIDFACVCDFQKRARKVHTEMKSSMLADFIFYCLRKAQTENKLVVTGKAYSVKEETVRKARCSDMVKDEILRLNNHTESEELLSMEILRELTDWDLYYLLNYSKAYDIDLGSYSLQSICYLWNEFCHNTACR